MIDASGSAATRDAPITNGLDRLTIFKLTTRNKRVRQRLDSGTKWNLVVTGLAVAAGVAAHYVANEGWRRVRHGEPPDNPAAPDVSWSEALVWAGFTSLIVGLARLLASRGAAAGWRRMTGRSPPFK